MARSLSLMEFLRALVGDAALREAFVTDPHDILHAYGLHDLSPADVADALVLARRARASADTDGYAIRSLRRPPAPARYEAGSDGVAQDRSVDAARGGGRGRSGRGSRRRRHGGSKEGCALPGWAAGVSGPV